MEPETSQQELERYNHTVSLLAPLGFTSPIGGRRWQFAKDGTVYDLSAANLDKIDQIANEGQCVVGRVKTPEELNRLKLEWRADPTWDIENTGYFEAYYDELLAYRVETEARWERERYAKLHELAEALGCPGNLTLAAYVERLERRLEALESQCA